MNSPRTDIAAIVLTYNEAHRLRACLESAAWCDEIVVVDGHSTDGTVAIAREFTDRVFLSDRLGPENPGGFGAQRNFALEQARATWVFFLDADERFTPELRDEIQARGRAGIPPGVGAFRVRRKEHFFGVFTPYTHAESWLTRLCRRDGARWDDRLVHEGIAFAGTLESLDHRILHFSKDSISDYLRTQNRYTSLEAEEAFRAGAHFEASPLRGIVHTFLNVYVYKRSYREGAFGFIMAALFAQYYFLTWAKRWELEMRAGRVAASAPRVAWLERPAAVFAALWNRLSPPR